jgi:integrase
MCPGELYPLRWENVLLTRDSGLIQIIKGKTKARRRFLSMVPIVFDVLSARHQAQGYPNDGWVFPSGSASGHLEQGSAKNQHAKAVQLSGIKPFEPYILRHTGLTDLAETGCDAYTLAKIAGHSSITITQRYCHPQAEAIERAFERKAAHGRKLVTCGSHPVNLLTEGGKVETSLSLAVSVD